MKYMYMENACIGIPVVSPYMHLIHIQVCCSSLKKYKFKFGESHCIYILSGYYMNTSIYVLTKKAHNIIVW